MARTGEMDRRTFVLAGMGLVLSGCVALVTHPVPVNAGRVRLQLSAHPDLARAGGALKILPDGHTDPIYVLAANAGFVALSPICTHRGCTVDVHGPRLVCPCHGSTYDREGRVLRGPAPRALTRFAVEREGDELTIRLTGDGP